MLKTTGARLFGTFLGYIILVILLLTLNPFYLVPSTQRVFTVHSSLDNFVANNLLFLPVGFFYRLATARRGAFLLGAGLSLSIETAQPSSLHGLLLLWIFWQMHSVPYLAPFSMIWFRNVS